MAYVKLRSNGRNWHVFSRCFPAYVASDKHAIDLYSLEFGLDIQQLHPTIADLWLQCYYPNLTRDDYVKAVKRTYDHLLVATDGQACNHVVTSGRMSGNDAVAAWKLLQRIYGGSSFVGKHYLDERLADLKCRDSSSDSLADYNWHFDNLMYDLAVLGFPKTGIDLVCAYARGLPSNLASHFVNIVYQLDLNDVRFNDFSLRLLNVVTELENSASPSALAVHLDNTSSETAHSDDTMLTESLVSPDDETTAPADVSLACDTPADDVSFDAPTDATLETSAETSLDCPSITIADSVLDTVHDTILDVPAPIISDVSDAPAVPDDSCCSASAPVIALHLDPDRDVAQPGSVSSTTDSALVACSKPASAVSLAVPLACVLFTLATSYDLQQFAAPGLGGVPWMNSLARIPAVT
eukprot:Colp12_sorted_trinity150504_noHs@862